MQNTRQAREHVMQGVAALQQGRRMDARRACEQALGLDRDCVEAYLMLARLTYPGETYLTILHRIHRMIEPETYVEIGVKGGVSLSCALPKTQCIGIDPDPGLGIETGDNTRIFSMTSDDFFESHDMRRLLRNRSIDLGFIDGLHIFENVLRDFIHMERLSSSTGTLLIHDCLPFDEITSARERSTRYWTGDVWRILPVLARFRPDLSLTVIACAPSGLAIVRNLDPTSNVLSNEYNDVLNFGFSFPLSHAFARPIGDIEVISSEWSSLSQVLHCLIQ